MRIGFVSAELSTGSSASLWPSVASMFPSGGKDTLIVFSGGRLYSQDPIERMRNSIYEMVTPENLDGSIIWSSSLTGMAKSEDVIEAFRSMLSKPMVTIDGKTTSYPNIPNVRFNASEGTIKIVDHCIERHGARRIAYIRGPEYHNSAQERYRAFLESMHVHGLEVDMDLVSDPMPQQRVLIDPLLDYHFNGYYGVFENALRYFRFRTVLAILILLAANLLIGAFAFLRRQYRKIQEKSEQKGGKA